MNDNLLYVSNNLRNSLAALKKKVSNVKVNLEHLDAEIEKFDIKFDKMQNEIEIFKVRLERDMGREVRRLEKELAEAKKKLEEGLTSSQSTSEETLKIATTVTIFECLLRQICENSDDFRLISNSYLFPAVIERVVSGTQTAYFLEEMPVSSEEVIKRGRAYLKWIREDCDTHLTDPDAWAKYSEVISEWWRNDALPLIYGARDDDWDLDIPLSLAEMAMWRDTPAERPIHFSPIFDAYEIYVAHKDDVYSSSGARDFDLKMFSFNKANESNS
jgi:hypothetical protein